MNCIRDLHAVESSRRFLRRHPCVRRKRQAGFTIVELIIIMFIIMIISAMAVPALQSAIGAAKIGRAVADLRTIGNDALGYDAQYGSAPNNLTELGYDQNIDPWGHSYQYRNSTDGNGNGQLRVDRFDVAINTYFDLYSLGPDGLSASSLTSSQSQDDILWAGDGTFIGQDTNY
ncbi:MAG: prepilin-type N-terminal cleavage/methylation domain-containing protein [Acidobacteriota bacterium]|nr:prepilin-type N-terminal cleavage/methylation domain-containing protein [Acidobacteriota bacterium]